MEILWAPWRLEYIKMDKKKNGCILCNVQKEEKKSLVLYSGTFSFVVLNKFPYNTGHIMICPKKHIAELENLSPKETNEIGIFTQKSIAILKEAIHPMGFNVGLNLGCAAGAGIEDHLHYHIVPRWVGDINFMPMVGKTKIISTHLQDMYKKLLPAFKKIRLPK